MLYLFLWFNILICEIGSSVYSQKFINSKNIKLEAQDNNNVVSDGLLKNNFGKLDKL